MAYAGDPITGFKILDTGQSFTLVSTGSTVGRSPYDKMQFQVNVIMRDMAPTPAGYSDSLTKTSSGGSSDLLMFYTVEIQSTGYISNIPYAKQKAGVQFDLAKLPTIQKRLDILARIGVPRSR
jgi:hypothetical protein